MTCIAAHGKFGMSRFMIHSGAGDLAAKGQYCCGCVVVYASAFVSPVAVLAVVTSRHLSVRMDVQAGGR